MAAAAAMALLFAEKVLRELFSTLQLCGRAAEASMRNPVRGSFQSSNREANRGQTITNVCLSFNLWFS